MNLIKVFMKNSKIPLVDSGGIFIRRMEVVMAKDRTEQYLSSIANELARIRRILQKLVDLSCAETMKEEKNGGKE